MDFLGDIYYKEIFTFVFFINGLEKGRGFSVFKEKFNPSWLALRSSLATR